MKLSRTSAAFTLVELIVVITILAILGTIGFLSLQGYSTSARDSERTADIVQISKGLDVLVAKGTLLPRPDANVVTLSVSGAVIGYQWYAGTNVQSAIGFGGKGKDPLDSQYYTYLVNAAQTRHQILWLMEGSSVAWAPFVQAAYAGAYDTRAPSARWSSLGVLLGTGANLNQPVQEMSLTGVDIANTTTAYAAYFSKNEIISGTGSKLLAVRTALAASGDLPTYDASLVAYWDMETTLSNGMLADLSWNGNHGSASGGITIGWTDSNGSLWKATSFDGTNDFIDLGTFDPSAGSMTLSFWLYKDSYNGSNTEEIIGKRDGWASDLSDHRWAFYIRGANKTMAYGRYWFEVLTPSATKLGSWTNYTFTYSTGSTAKWFENWTLVGSGPAFTFSNKTNARITLGRAGSQNGEYLLGKLDEVRIYNRALSDSEAQALYYATK